MRVAYASSWDVPCGVAQYSRSLVGELRKTHRVDVISLDGCTAQSVPELVRRLNDSDAAHIQHQYSFFGGMAVHRNWFYSLLSNIKVPTIVTVHDLDLGETDKPHIRIYKRLFNRRILAGRNVQRLITHSKEYHDKLAGLGINPGIIRIIPEGAPQPAPRAISAEDAKAELGIPGKRAVTLFGFIVRRKGHSVAIDAARYFDKDTVLLFAGGAHPVDKSGFPESIIEQVRTSGLEDKIRVTGYLPDDKVPVVMAATDVVISPFTSASNSGSILKSVACGKPVVASDLPLMQEINARTPCLTLCRPGNPEDLACKVNELLGDEERLRAARDASSAYARNWSVEWAAAETGKVYEEIDK
jgi:glycosyltransferase involved in cell wall biosynthesis